MIYVETWPFFRSVKEGLGYIDELLAKGVRIHILNMGLIEDTPMGRLMVTNLLAFAEFERAMILERTQGGKAIAKQKPGYKEGRKAKVFDKTLLPGETVAQACQRLGISRSTWYK